MVMRTKQRAAKKAAARKRKPRASNGNGRPAVLDIPVEFGGVAIGDGTARLGITIDRSTLSLTDADKAFCGRRLTGQVILGGNDESTGQAYLFDDLHERLAGTFDVKRIGVNAKNLSTGLTFSLADIKSEGPWRKVQLDTLFSGALLESLKKAGLSTVGELSDFSSSDKRLIDVDGIGPGKAEQIENRMLAFWESNPQAE